MKYISAEQFLEQSKEVQKVFLDWWRPTELDIFQYKDYRIRLVDNGSSNTTIIAIENSFISYSKYDCIPLLTEGQLRRFIEDKTECIVSVFCKDYSNTYGYRIIHGFGEYDYEENTDLLQAYWQVACEVVKESLEIN